VIAPAWRHGQSPPPGAVKLIGGFDQAQSMRDSNILTHDLCAAAGVSAALAERAQNSGRVSAESNPARLLLNATATPPQAYTFLREA
jgi:hypothetical protein